MKSIDIAKDITQIFKDINLSTSGKLFIDCLKKIENIISLCDLQFKMYDQKFDKTQIKAILKANLDSLVTRKKK